AGRVDIEQEGDIPVHSAAGQEVRTAGYLTNSTRCVAYQVSAGVAVRPALPSAGHFGVRRFVRRFCLLSCEATRSQKTKAANKSPHSKRVALLAQELTRRSNPRSVGRTWTS